MNNFFGANNQSTQAGGNWGNPGAFGQQQTAQQSQQQTMYIYQQLYNIMQQVLQSAVQQGYCAPQVATVIANMHNPQWIGNSQNPQNAQAASTNLSGMANYIETNLRQQGMTLGNLQTSGQYIAQPMQRYVWEKITAANNQFNMQNQNGNWQQGHTPPMASNSLAAQLGNVPQNNSIMSGSLGFGNNPNQPSYTPPPSALSAPQKPVQQRQEPQPQPQQQPTQTPPQAPQKAPDTVSSGFGNTPVAKTKLVPLSLESDGLKDTVARMKSRGLTVTNVFTSHSDCQRNALAMVVNVTSSVANESQAFRIAQTGLGTFTNGFLGMVKVNYRQMRLIPLSKEDLLKLKSVFKDMTNWKSNNDYGVRLYNKFKDVLPQKHVDVFDRFVIDAFNERSVTFFRKRSELRDFCPLVDSLTDFGDLVEVLSKSLNGNMTESRDLINNILDEILMDLFDENHILDAERKHQKAFMKAANDIIVDGRDAITALTHEKMDIGDNWLNYVKNHYTLMVETKAFFLTRDMETDTTSFDVLIDDQSRGDVDDIFTALRFLQDGKDEKLNMGPIVREGMLKNFLLEGEGPTTIATEYTLVWTKLGSEQRVLFLKNGGESLEKKRKAWCA